MAPDFEETRRLRAAAAAEAGSGNWPACRALARKVLLRRPGDPAGAYYLSLAAKFCGHVPESGKAARRALAALPRPVLLPLHRDLFMLRGLAEENLTDLRRAVILTPEDGGSLFNAANALLRAGRHVAALPLFRRAAHIRPLDPATLAAIARIRGLLAPEGADMAEAAASFARALIIAPADSNGLRNFALWRRRLDDPGEGARWFRRAAAITPSSREIRGELGRALLSDGHLQEGWPHLQHYRVPRWAPPLAGLPRWDGTAPRGGALLLWSMDKIGDELLFSIFLERVRARAGRVIVIVDPRNIALLSRLHPDIRFAGDIAGLAGLAADWRPVAGYPLDFVGRFLARTPAEMASPGGLPTLPRPPARNSEHATCEHRRRRARGEELRIGISWKSDASFVGALKSTPPGAWRGLLEAPGCRFFSLQYGDVSADLAAMPEVETIAGFDPFGNTLAFAETVARLDLVITVANTTAHIAARTRVPVMVLLPKGFGCSWFWFRTRRDSPFYARTTLWRQKVAGDWSDVFHKLEARLLKTVLGDPGRGRP